MPLKNIYIGNGFFERSTFVLKNVVLSAYWATVRKKFVGCIKQYFPRKGLKKVYFKCQIN